MHPSIPRGVACAWLCPAGLRPVLGVLQLAMEARAAGGVQRGDRGDGRDHRGAAAAESPSRDAPAATAAPASPAGEGHCTVDRPRKMRRTSVGGLGCSKCRYSKSGCGKCREDRKQLLQVRRRRNRCSRAVPCIAAKDGHAGQPAQLTCACCCALDMAGNTVCCCCMTGALEAV
jgi:hypothetical protein